MSPSKNPIPEDTTTNIADINETGTGTSYNNNTSNGKEVAIAIGIKEEVGIAIAMDYEQEIPADKSENPQETDSSTNLIDSSRIFNNFQTETTDLVVTKVTTKSKESSQEEECCVNGFPDKSSCSSSSRIQSEECKNFSMNEINSQDKFQIDKEQVVTLFKMERLQINNVLLLNNNNNNVDDKKVNQEQIQYSIMSSEYNSNREEEGEEDVTDSDSDATITNEILNNDYDQDEDKVKVPSAPQIIIIGEEEGEEDENEFSEWTLGNNNNISISDGDEDDYSEGEEEENEQCKEGEGYEEYEEIEEEEEEVDQVSIINGIEVMESIQEEDEEEEESEEVNEQNLDLETLNMNDKNENQGFEYSESCWIDDNNKQDVVEGEILQEEKKNKYENLVKLYEAAADDDDDDEDDDQPEEAVTVTVTEKQYKVNDSESIQEDQQRNNHNQQQEQHEHQKEEEEKANQEQNGREITVEKANNNSTTTETSSSSQSTMNLSTFTCPSSSSCTIPTTSAITTIGLHFLSPSVTNETNINTYPSAITTASTGVVHDVVHSSSNSNVNAINANANNTEPMMMMMVEHAPYQTGISTWFHHPENHRCCSESGTNSSKNIESSSSCSSSSFTEEDTSSSNTSPFSYCSEFNTFSSESHTICNNSNFYGEKDNSIINNSKDNPKVNGESKQEDFIKSTSSINNNKNLLNEEEFNIDNENEEDQKKNNDSVLVINNNTCDLHVNKKLVYSNNNTSQKCTTTTDSYTQYVKDEISSSTAASELLQCDGDNNNNNSNYKPRQFIKKEPLLLQISRQLEAKEKEKEKQVTEDYKNKNQYLNCLLIEAEPTKTATQRESSKKAEEGEEIEKDYSKSLYLKEEIMHQRANCSIMANNSSSSSTPSSTTTLRSVLKRPGFIKQRRGRCVTFNESLNLFYDAECSCWIHEDEYTRMRQEEIERRERESELYHQQYEQQFQQQQQNQQQQQQQHPHHQQHQQYLQPYEFDEPPTLSPPEGYKDRFFPQEFMAMEPDVTRVSPPSPPAARRKVFLKESPGSIPNHVSLSNGQVIDEDERDAGGAGGIGHQMQQHPPHHHRHPPSASQQQQQQLEYETTKKKSSRLGGILKGGRLWRSNSNDGKKAATTPPDEPDIVKCSEASPTQYSQTEPLQQLPTQTQYYELNPIQHQQQQQIQQQPPTKVDIGTAPLRTSEQIRLAVDSTLRMRSKAKKPECSSLVEKLRWLTSLDDDDPGGEANQSGFNTWPARDKNGVSIISNGGTPNSGNSPNNSNNKRSTDAGTSTNEELFIQSSSSLRQQQPVQEAKIKQISYTLEDIEEGLKGNETELETFITKDGGRIERLRKRYGDDGSGSGGNGCADDYGFSRRPSVKGIKPKFSTTTQIFAQFTANANVAAVNRKATATPIPGQDSNVVPTMTSSGPPSLMNNVNPNGGIMMNQNQMIGMGQPGGEFHQPPQRVLMNNVVVGIGGECQYENTRLPENNLILGNSNSNSSNHPHVSVLGQLPPSSSSTSTISSNSNEGGGSSNSSSSNIATTGNSNPNNGNNNAAVRNAALNYEFQNAPGRQTEESRAHFEMIRQTFESAASGGGVSGNGGNVAVGAGPGGNFVNFNRPHSWSVSTLPHPHSAAANSSGNTSLGHTQSFNTQHHHYQQQHNHSNSISGPIVTTIPGQQQQQQQQSNHIQNNIYGTLQHQHSFQQQQQQQPQPIYGTVRRVPNVIGRPLFLHYNGALSVEAHPNKIVYPNPKTKVPETPSPTQPPTVRYYGPPIRYYNPPPPVPPRTVTAQQQQQQQQQQSNSTSSSVNNSGIIISAQAGINNLNHPYGGANNSGNSSNSGGSHGNHPHVNVLLTMNDVERGVPEGATDEEPNLKEPYPMNV